MRVETRTSDSVVDPALLRNGIETAMVLVEIGDLDEAENEVVRVLAEHPDLYDARGLLARIKHRKGELTQAFTFWAQLRALRPESGSAQMRLNTMLQLAQDPERGAGEFLALGRLHLWKKPVQMLELERVFQLFARRLPEEARGACELLAGKYRASDRDLYKLAVLARAWIAELSGDLEGARGILEDLGRERGFEDDVDRAMALTRIYPQLGGADHLRRAVHVSEFLARTLTSFQQVCALGTLAALHRELGEEEEAERWDAEFLAAFERKTFRISRAEAIAVAARRHVPLRRLLAVRFTEARAAEEDMAPERSPATPPAGRARRREPPLDPEAREATRRRAIALALAGDRQAAADLLRRCDERIDLHYLADLALAGGDRAGAIGLLLEALERAPSDPSTIGRLLLEVSEQSDDDDFDDRVYRRDRRDHRDRRILDAFAGASLRAAAFEVLERAVRETPLRPELWQQLAALHRIGRDADAARRCEARAKALAAADARREHAIGRALSAAVYHFAGDAQGLIHELWAGRVPAAPGQGGHLAEILGSVKPELEHTVRNILVSVREYAQAKLPHPTRGIDDWNYTLKITKEDEPSGGDSAGLPIALAFLSVFLGRPLRQDLASSGALIADAHDVLVVQPVGEVEHKVRGAYNRSLRLLLLPEGNRETLETSLMVPRPITGELVRFVASFDQAVTLAFGSDVWLS